VRLQHDKYIFGNYGVMDAKGHLWVWNKKLVMTHPKLLNKLNCESKGENNERIRNWGMLLGSQHFKARRACWSSRMGTRMNYKLVNYSHELTHTKQQVDWCIIGTFFVHGRAMGNHKVTRLTMAQT
jgi:hypothetical protein